MVCSPLCVLLSCRRVEMDWQMTGQINEGINVDPKNALKKTAGLTGVWGCRPTHEWSGQQDNEACSLSFGWLSVKVENCRSNPGAEVMPIKFPTRPTVPIVPLSTLPLCRAAAVPSIIDVWCRQLAHDGFKRPAP